jgi:hypothetical protein
MKTKIFINGKQLENIFDLPLLNKDVTFLIDKEKIVEISWIHIDRDGFQVLKIFTKYFDELEEFFDDFIIKE